MQKIVECVPNFSEGRDRSIIEAIAAEVSSTENILLLDVDPGKATNRTVFTFIGSPEGVKEAAFKAIKKASELIDMQKQTGEHPRIGAADVVPFVPVSGVTMEDCVQLAHDLGQRVGEELHIPVYLYEEAATQPERRNLADIRKGEYESLPEKLKDPHWKPDYGPAEFNPRTGATVIGAREFLIAYNINLNTRDRKLAQEIALNLRESGRAKRDETGQIVRNPDGTALKVPGRLKAVKGVGWYIDEYGIAQVSYNLTNYKVTPLYRVFEESQKEAGKLGLRVTGSELVGLIPLEAIKQAGCYFLEKQGKTAGVPEEEIIHIAVKSLGLDDLGPFDPEQKIIEYRFQERFGPLAKMRLWEFSNELSMDSPTPGGGSAAALSGALAAALVSMVANLTYGNKKYEQHWDAVKPLAVKAQELKDRLLKAVDRDTAAFDAVMDAYRRPKKTEEDQKARENAIQQATKGATGVPLEVMELAFETLQLAKTAAEKGNVNSISDAGVAALMALSAVEGAYLNVKINLGAIEDNSFKTGAETKAGEIRKKAMELKHEIWNLVEKNR
ncbi:methenyltetrahydrofolate cyclohydrolase [bacterium BMS3Abin05]|nr:methenyltetrahydrofolate cyclohydrolase [bacterium BMS3Abin05]GBE28457.1 methenyltetrahydrofolate cyclohydrolase [bacterium BMS3Bbin03]HDZ11908.1 glutamate formimidoyltransferase [Bacteroidota bacterium]